MLLLFVEMKSTIWIKNHIFSNNFLVGIVEKERHDNRNPQYIIKHNWCDLQNFVRACHIYVYSNSSNSSSSFTSKFRFRGNKKCTMTECVWFSQFCRKKCSSVGLLKIQNSWMSSAHKCYRSSTTLL